MIYGCAQNLLSIDAHQNMRRQVRTVLLLLLLHLLSAKCWSQSNQTTASNAELQEIELTPFQLVFYADNGDAEITSSVSVSGKITMTETRLVQLTRQHIAQQLRQSDARFRNIIIYHTLRSSAENLFLNATKIAFGGQVLYNTSVAANNLSSNGVTDLVYMSFMNEFEAEYVQRLRNAGWSSLYSIMLMTATGNMIEMVDGNMTEIDIGGTTDKDTNDVMSEDMYMTMYTTAILVPTIILGLMLLYWVVYRLRHHANCLGGMQQAEERDIWRTDSMLPATVAAAERGEVTATLSKEHIVEIGVEPIPSSAASTTSTGSSVRPSIGVDE